MGIEPEAAQKTEKRAGRLQRIASSTAAPFLDHAANSLRTAACRIPTLRRCRCFRPHTVDILAVLKGEAGLRLLLS